MRERFDEAFRRVAASYEERMADEHDTFESLSPSDFAARRDEFLLAVGEDTATLLHDLVIGLGAKVIVELGTSYGYSTLFLAAAARRTGGKVYTFDLIPDKQAYARRRLAEAGLADFVEFRHGNAVELLESQPGPVDFVLLDIWKDLYIACFEQAYPLLAPNGMIVADNMLYPENTRPHAAAYGQAVRAKSDVEAMLLPIGSGIDVAIRRSPE
jgi:predicted O-methyltransferase YrrM